MATSLHEGPANQLDLLIRAGNSWRPVCALSLACDPVCLMYAAVLTFVKLRGEVMECEIRK